MRTRSLCYLALSALLTPVLSAADSDATSQRLGSKIYAWDELEVKVTPVGQRRDVVDLPTATLARFESHVTTLRPGATSHPPHTHPQEEFIILKEGALDVGINGKVERVEAGSIFFFAANDAHNVNNVGDSAATYLVFNLATAATKSAPQEGVAAAKMTNVLPSSIFHWAKTTPTATKVGERRELFDSPTATCRQLRCHVTTLRGGEISHPAHRHPDEEIIVVKEGQVEVILNGSKRIVGPGSICFFASNDEHGLKNASAEPATYYVFRVATELTQGAAAP